MCLTDFYRLEMHSLVVGIFDPACEFVAPMDEGTLKTPNPKFRLFWCLIEIIDWSSGVIVSHVGIFDPSSELLPLWPIPSL
jgi:hypothetical protein